LSPKGDVTFRTLFQLQVNGEAEEIQWEIILKPPNHPANGKDKIEPVSEKISSITHNKTLLKMDPDGFERYNWEKNEIEHFPTLNLAVSLLTTVDIKKDNKKFPSLAALKKFVLGIDTFQLLSPEKLRDKSPGEADSIGQGGEYLAGFIHGLSAAKKENLKKRLKKYIPFIEDIGTRVRGESGWIEMNISEEFRGMGKPVTVNTMHSSDGILRMVAISALAESERDVSVILLDEIEDGINPYLAANLVNDLLEISKEKQRQVVVTTHSSVMLDYFPADAIVFIWRDKDGKVKNGNLFENEEIKKSLEYMSPGE
ncbi:MAG: ATP-binding protein, partial [bacterium]|nr:ATP-binding protein [bacterium]